MPNWGIMVAKKKDLEKKIRRMQGLESIKWDVPDNLNGRILDDAQHLDTLLAEVFPQIGPVKKEEEWSTILPGFTRYIINTSPKGSPSGEYCFAYECGSCKKVMVGPPQRQTEEDTIGPDKTYRNGQVTMDYICTNNRCGKVMLKVKF